MKSTAPATPPVAAGSVSSAESAPAPTSDATAVLQAAGRGDPQAAEQLLELVYGELRRLAAHRLAQEPSGQTLQPTALVHEAWLRLVGDTSPEFTGRAHFFAAAAQAMRHILIDRARRKLAVRHGGRWERVEFTEPELVAAAPDRELLAVHEVLDRLAETHPAQAQVVHLRYFAGMTNEEVARVLGVSVGTVKNYWTFARAWLHHAIHHG